LGPDKLQPRGLAHATKRFGRHQRDVVTPLPEDATDPDKRVYVAARSDRRQEEVGH
jgi:hypothetical protein